jgi:hypothetical protein
MPRRGRILLVSAAPAALVALVPGRSRLPHRKNVAVIDALLTQILEEVPQWDPRARLAEHDLMAVPVVLDVL